MCRSSPSPTPTTMRGCCAGLRSASTTICCARSTRTNCWRARAPRSASGATPIICATTCRTRSRWRSPTRSPACITAATWRAIWPRWPSRPRRAASRWRVMMLDIDFFKSINDTYGHDAGDDVLREFAVRIRKSIRGIDLACRYGGEEFVIVMPETDMPVAGMVAERLRRRIAGEPFAIKKGERRSRSRSRSGCRGRGRRRRRHAQARRQGAVSRQARRPQPRGLGRSLTDAASRPRPDQPSPFSLMVRGDRRHFAARLISPALGVAWTDRGWG